MKITLQQTADILNRSIDEVLYIAHSEQRLNAFATPDDDMVYNEDGTVTFKEEGNSVPSWEFDINEVLEFKKEMDEGLVGEVEQILEGK